jgi:hypothetical protein
MGAMLGLLLDQITDTMAPWWSKERLQTITLTFELLDRGANQIPVRPSRMTLYGLNRAQAPQMPPLDERLCAWTLAHRQKTFRSTCAPNPSPIEDVTPPTLLQINDLGAVLEYMVKVYVAGVP